ncbi:MAG: ABC transporter substrate-binding protein [Clostridia bacterium]|nr:ABC transporter substrate-binding protein [Clostridia bacterium]
MLKKLILFVICSSLLLSFGCSGKNNNTKTALPSNPNMNYPYSFTDSEGNEITLYEEPKNVAVLFSSYAEIWTLAGGKVNITVYESVERGFADKDCILVDSSSGHTSINTELLIASEPDLVIATKDHEIQTKAASLCRENGIPSAVFKIESFNDYLEMLKICTDLLNRKSLYEKNGSDIEEKINSLISLTSDCKDKKEILFIRTGSSQRSCKAKTAENNFVCVMLNELNTQNIADSSPLLFENLSLEEILVHDPEHIFITTMGDEDAAKEYMNSLLENKQWNSLSAVKKGNCHYLPKELFHYKPNARWYEAYLYLAEILYPELDFEN